MHITEKEKINKILYDQFGIAGIHQIRQIKGKSMCLIFKVETDKGQHYILKIKPNTLFEQRKVFEFREYMRNNHICIPKPYRTLQGNPFSAIDKYILEVQEFIENDNKSFAFMPVRDNHYLSCIKLLHEFQNNSYNYEKNIVGPTYFYNNMNNRLYSRGLINLLFSQPILFGEKIIKIIKENADGLPAICVITELLNDLALILELTLPDITKQQKIMNHGDFHIGNILFRGDNIVALIDFDFTFTEIYCYDLITLLGYAAFLFNPFCPEKRDIPPIQNSLVERMIESYIHNIVNFKVSELLIRRLLHARLIGLVLFMANLCTNAEDIIQITKEFSLIYNDIKRIAS